MPIKMPDVLTPEQQAQQDAIVTSKGLLQRYIHSFVSMMRGKHNSCWSERKGVFYKKIDYKSQETCEKSARKLTYKNGRVMDAYQCWYCRGWHIGNATNLTFWKFWSILWVWIIRKKRTGPKIRPWEQTDVSGNPDSGIK
jgi:hypothetical protein